MLWSTLNCVSESSPMMIFSSNKYLYPSFIFPFSSSLIVPIPSFNIFAIFCSAGLLYCELINSSEPLLIQPSFPIPKTAYQLPAATFFFPA
jgi:hypothetical protein